MAILEKIARYIILKKYQAASCRAADRLVTPPPLDEKWRRAAESKWPLRRRRLQYRRHRTLMTGLHIGSVKSNCLLARAVFYN